MFCLTISWYSFMCVPFYYNQMHEHYYSGIAILCFAKLYEVANFYNHRIITKSHYISSTKQTFAVFENFFQ